MMAGLISHVMLYCMHASHWNKYHSFMCKSDQVSCLVCRSAAQALGTDPISVLLNAAQTAPAPAPALTGLSGALSGAGSLVNQTVSGVRQNLQSAAAGLNLTVSQVRAPALHFSHLI